MHRAVLAALVAALLLPFSCKCPSSGPEQVEPSSRRPVKIERPLVLDPKSARQLKFKDKLRLSKQRPFLPPGVGQQPPGAASQPASQPLDPAAGVQPAGAGEAEAAPPGEGAPAPQPGAAKTPATKANPNP